MIVHRSEFRDFALNGQASGSATNPALTGLLMNILHFCEYGLLSASAWAEEVPSAR
jgi:hypothetical protein